VLRVPTLSPATQIRGEFDRIATLIAHAGAPLAQERWLQKHLPRDRGTLLEIGCGIGELSRTLADSFDRVVAIDFSEGMIAEARRRTTSHNIELVCAEMFDWLGRASDAYDCIITVATLHHVDVRAALRSMAQALKPGGTLLVIDLVDRPGWRRYAPLNMLALLTATIRNLRYARNRAFRELRAAYEEHGRHETYLTMPEVRAVVRDALPNAKVREHLLWRYSVVWTRPRA
jgi:2-polyprenyl-3-methyl-5-hydroxy-6-metoxy-1,4-benzoquinol methylase